MLNADIFPSIKNLATAGNNYLRARVWIVNMNTLWPESRFSEFH